jgi:hypothetical protein
MDKRRIICISREYGSSGRMSVRRWPRSSALLATIKSCWKRSQRKTALPRIL